MDMQGGCLCGAVRYKYSGEVLRTAICYCRDCQRASGSAFHVGVLVAGEGFIVTRGGLRADRAIGDSGRWIDRSFCPICGSGILHALELRSSDVMVIKVGSLDEPSVVTPEYE